MNINEFYVNMVCNKIAMQPPELNKRTGITVHASPGVMFKTDVINDGFPLLSLRSMPFSFVPEIMWFLSGSNKVEWLSSHTKIWDSFAEENGQVTSAYGFRWRYHFGVDQIELALQKLKADPSSRHAVVMMWDPATDLTVPQKNVPCPYSFTLNIIRGKLHLHLIIRSNDMVLGFPTDVAGFALLLHILAQELRVRPGLLTVSISNAHVYSNQLEAIEEMAYRTYDEFPPVHFRLPENAYARACSLDETLIAEIKAGFSNYNPHPAIKNIPIAI